VSSASISTDSPAAAHSRPNPSAIPYSALTIGIPLETYPSERRVAITPQNAALLLKKGFARVLVEHGAGAEAQFTDDAYKQAGATLVERKTLWSDSDILLKVRAPSIDGPDCEADALREGGTIISFLYPAKNKNVVDKLASRRATSFAMDMIPRISRAQAFDALRCAGALGTLGRRLTIMCCPARWQTSPGTRLSWKPLIDLVAS
jgi:H+-translocating NAD(P) transhydrogenase